MNHLYISFDRRQLQRGPLGAEISVDGQTGRLGLFESEEAAAPAYDERAKALLRFPTLNFLPDDLLNPDRLHTV